MKYHDSGMIPLGIYVHIPFCVKKCDYCDFFSGPAEPEEQKAYIWALIKEIRRFRQKNSRFRVKTVFFGGGTPSLLPGKAIAHVMETLRDCFTFDGKGEPEISLEANPGTVTEEKLAVWKEAGVNRVSFGTQSAENRELALLGRIHTWEQFLESWEMAARAGFRNRNIDLMMALPGQTVEGWLRTLRTAAALRPEHLSAYSLTIEEGTPFYRKFAEPEVMGPIRLPDEEEERQMYGLTRQTLYEYGYERYEISNYSLPGFSCRHNCGYWEGVYYIGFGAGASSLILETVGLPAEEKLVRRRNIRNVDGYIRRAEDGLPLTEERIVMTEKDQMEEFMFLGLRMDKGISYQGFQRRFGCSFADVYGPVTRKLKQQGLLRDTLDGICLTDFGTDVSNYVFEAYLL